MTQQTPREILDLADRLKKRSSAAEYARTLIRLGEKPETRRGILGFWKRNPERPHVLDDTTTMAVYAALAIVRDDAQREAEKLEARVEAKP